MLEGSMFCPWRVPVGEVQFLEHTQSKSTTARQFVYAPLEGAKTYQVESETGLFLMFAETPTTREGVLKFIGNYGFLGLVQGFDDANRMARARGFGDLASLLDKPKGFPNAELFDAWQAEIELMRFLVVLWNSIRVKNTSALAKFVSWESGSCRVWLPLPHLMEFNRGMFYQMRLGVSGNSKPFWPGPKDGDASLVFQPGDFLSPVVAFIRRAVNGSLERQVSVTLHADAGRTELKLIPSSLLAAMYLQFALAIDGDKKYQQCPVCERWFELAPGVNRANRLTCSDACKSRAYRQRQELALQMHAAGKKPRQIAMELGSTVETVKGWISKKGE